MGMFTRLTSMLARSTPGAVLEPGEHTPAGSSANSGLTPEHPVKIDLEMTFGAESNGDGHPAKVANGSATRGDLSSASSVPIATPRNRHELVAELQKNYAEVVELVRKVSAHLDRQEDRAARLLQIAERVPEAVDAIPELRAQNERLHGALGRVAVATEASDARLTTAVDRLGEVRASMDQMAGADLRASAALQRMCDDAASRHEELAQLLIRGRRWLLVTGVALAGVLLTALSVSVIALVFSQR